MAEKFTASLKKLFFHPKKFFDSVEKDKDYSKIMFFYVKMTIISVVISFICSLIILSVQNKLMGVFSLITSGIFNIGIAFAIPFIVSFIVQIGVWIFRGKQGYFNTYKAVTYPLAIILIYGILSTLIASIIGLANPVSITQDQLTSNPELILQEQGFIASMIVSIIIFLVSLIHSLCVQVIGVARFQKRSKLRAFLAIIIIPLVLIIIGILVMSYMVKQLIAAGI